MGEQIFKEGVEPRGGRGRRRRADALRDGLEELRGSSTAETISRTRPGRGSQPACVNALSMEPLEQRHARHTPTDATDDRHRWMVHENIN